MGPCNGIFLKCICTLWENLFFHGVQVHLYTTIRPSTAIQNAARKSLEKSQDIMSEQRTRRQPRAQAITNGQENINLMDQVIIKKGQRGRPRKQIEP